MLDKPSGRGASNAVIFNELISRSHDVKFVNNVGLPNSFIQNMNTLLS